MKLLHDWHIPDWDRHYENVMLQYNNKWSYQQLQRDFALNKVKEWDIAIDIGANVGFWTKELCSKFRFVWAFEPGRENWECCHKNLEGVKNYQLEQVAISNIEAENVELYNTSSSCGDMRIKPIGKKAPIGYLYGLPNRLRTLSTGQIGNLHPKSSSLTVCMQNPRN